MKVKKFVAPSMPEALKVIREELGKDAVILNSKVIQVGGIFGFFTKKNIEVIAAVDPNPMPAKPIIQQKLQPAQDKDKKMNRENGENENLLQEINELKKLIKDEVSTRDKNQLENYPDQIGKVNRLLFDLELSDDIRQDLLAILLEKWYLNKANATSEDVNSWLKDELLKKVIPFEYGGIDFSKKYINVVGPTGVGKTTTLAKMAALTMLKHRKKVAFITTDTYRIAAIEQLKTYAEILNVPVEIAYNLDDFKKATNKFTDYDMVFIDTAGRNFRNEKYVQEIKEIIDFEKEMETYLVLSLTSKLKDMTNIVNQFSLIHFSKFIFTKVDETSSYGAAINLVQKYKTGVAYFTVGQDVPDDIIEASPEAMIKILFGEEKYEGSS